MCLYAGIVRTGEIADHTVPHRGEASRSPTVAQHNLDQTSPLRVRQRLVERSRVREPKEESARERNKNFWESQKPALAQRRGRARRTE